MPYPVDEIPKEVPVSLKNGLLTSEWWITAVTSTLAILGAVGVIGAEVQSELASNIEKVVLGIFALFTIGGYVRSRTTLKEDVIMANAELVSEQPTAEPTVEEQPVVTKKK